MVDAASPIYHMCRRDEWQAARAEGVYLGSLQDVADGFIHFSSRDQVAASAAKHRAGQDGLVLLTVDPGAVVQQTEIDWGRQTFPTLEIREMGPGIHFVQEDQPEAIGKAIAQWLDGLG